MALESPPQAKAGIPWVWSQWFEQVYIWVTRSRPTLMTEQASTSGTSIDFTNIPAWAKKITVMFVGVSTSGTDEILIQIGDSGGIESSGYLATSSNITTGVGTTSFTISYGLRSVSATAVLHGDLFICLEDAANNTWVAGGVINDSATPATITTSGSKSLSDTLTQVRITTVNGTDTFDAGAINVMYE